MPVFLSPFSFTQEGMSSSAEEICLDAPERSSPVPARTFRVELAPPRVTAAASWKHTISSHCPSISSSNPTGSGMARYWPRLLPGAGILTPVTYPESRGSEVPRDSEAPSSAPPRGCTGASPSGRRWMRIAEYPRGGADRSWAWTCWTWMDGRTFSVGFCSLLPSLVLYLHLQALFSNSAHHQVVRGRCNSLCYIPARYADVPVDSIRESLAGRVPASAGPWGQACWTCPWF